MPAQTTKKTEKPANTDVFSNIATKFEAYTGNEPYLFVSYSHRDSAIVYPILDALYDKKYRIWYDESCETGNDFRDELRKRIEKAEAVLLFVSESSMTSRFCGMEIIVARENNKRLFPIYVDDSDIPPAFQLLLENTHHGSADNMKKLLDSLVRDLPAVAMDRLTLDKEKKVLEKCEDNGESIEVTDNVVEIAAKAFHGRTKLSKIKLPDSLESIGDESFRGCNKLSEMIIPEKTIRIGESAFRDCVAMKKLTIKNKCIKIGERAFENCSALSDIDLPDGLTEIYGGVFNSCKSIKQITLPSKLTILGESAFSDCVSLESIDIPETVTKIDDLAFNGCESLKTVSFHQGLKKIGKSAFKNCNALTNIFIPASVSNISNAPFRGCEALKSIKVDSKNKNYKSEPNKRDGNDHVLFNKNKSVIIAYPANSREIQYDIPDSVMIVSDWAFCDCKELSRVAIPDSVHEIGEGAFSNCAKLNDIEVPDSVISIDDCAFRGCSSLKRISIPSTVVDIGWGMFDGCDQHLIVYCDEDSAIQKYCQANGIMEARFSEWEND